MYISRDASISGKYLVSGIIRHFFNFLLFYFFIRSTNRILLVSENTSDWNLILLNFWFFSYTNVLEINIYIHDAIFYNISYIVAKLLFFPYRLFFLEDTFSESDQISRKCRISDPKKLSSRIFDITFCPDIRYPLSGNFMIRCIPIYNLD